MMMFYVNYIIIIIFIIIRKIVSYWEDGSNILN